VKLAFISDIHANLEALEPVLEDVETHSPDETICLGDIVGYGADPSDCLKLVRERCSTIILGNHDEAAFNPDQAMYFNFHARVAVEWTYKTLTEEERNYLKTLPFTASKEDILCVHATPDQPDQWEYIIDEVDAENIFSSFSERLCCLGHSHVAAIYPENSDLEQSDPAYRAVINVGSVGQPRDRDPRASWCLIDTDTKEISIRRIEYDIDAAAGKIRKAGLPPQLAERLYLGM
jgi:diadenosine tetraphosphatase ApaH/serine/threonine PP2A family protein phosphatase